MESGWSIKAMHRLLMLSRVYQQSSDDRHRHETRDPDNRLLSKWNRRRVDFEAMRDTLLFVTGKLSPAIGGRPVALQSQDPADPDAYSRRRAVYGSIDRNNLLSLLGYFDFANPDLSTARRDITTVPQQAFSFSMIPSSCNRRAAWRRVPFPAFRDHAGTNPVRLPAALSAQCHARRDRPGHPVLDRRRVGRFRAREFHDRSRGSWPFAVAPTVGTICACLVDVR